MFDMSRYSALTMEEAIPRIATFLHNRMPVRSLCCLTTASHSSMLPCKAPDPLVGNLGGLERSLKLGWRPRLVWVRGLARLLWPPGSRHRLP